MDGPYRKTWPSREVITRPELAVEQLRAEAVEIATVLVELGAAEVVFECAAGRARLPIADLVAAIAGGLPAQRLEPWTGSYRPDPTLYVLDREIEFEFCHEDQVHVRAEDKALLERFWSRWRSRGYAFGRRHGDEWDWDEAAP